MSVLAQAVGAYEVPQAILVALSYVELALVAAFVVTLVVGWARRRRRTGDRPAR